MGKINLDFSIYDLRGENFWEVEADRDMGEGFGYGYATVDYAEFINYVVGLSLFGERLDCDLDGVEFSHRFCNFFPIMEKNTIRAILGMRGELEGDLESEILNMVKSNSVLYDMKSEESRVKLGVFFPEC